MAHRVAEAPVRTVPALLARWASILVLAALLAAGLLWALLRYDTTHGPRTYAVPSGAQVAAAGPQAPATTKPHSTPRHQAPTTAAQKPVASKPAPGRVTTPTTTPQPAATFSAPKPVAVPDYRVGRTTVTDPRAGNKDDLFQCANDAIVEYQDDPVSFVRDIALQRCLYFYDRDVYTRVMNGSY